MLLNLRRSDRAASATTKRPARIGAACFLAIAAAAGVRAETQTCPADRYGIPLSYSEFLVYAPNMAGLSYSVHNGWPTSDRPDPGIRFVLRCQYAGPDDTVDIPLTYDHDRCERIRMPGTRVRNFVCD